jgi:predicted AlkP superfamily pyrophosphatase or phosphodiesterase
MAGSFIVCVCIAVILMRVGSAKYARQVLLVSMDGFRWDYVNQTSTPNFDRMARQGTHAQYINSTFITKTFPDHYTIVTGKYHGLCCLL